MAFRKWLSFSIKFYAIILCFHVCVLSRLALSDSDWLTDWSCLTLCNSMDCGLPVSSAYGILQQEYWSGLPFPSPKAATCKPKTEASEATPAGSHTSSPQNCKKINVYCLSHPVCDCSPSGLTQWSTVPSEMALGNHWGKLPAVEVSGPLAWVVSHQEVLMRNMVPEEFGRGQRSEETTNCPECFSLESALADWCSTRKDPEST